MVEWIPPLQEVQGEASSSLWHHWHSVGFTGPFAHHRMHNFEPSIQFYQPGGISLPLCIDGRDICSSAVVAMVPPCPTINSNRNVYCYIKSQGNKCCDNIKKFQRNSHQVAKHPVNIIYILNWLLTNSKIEPEIVLENVNSGIRCTMSGSCKILCESKNPSRERVALWKPILPTLHQATKKELHFTCDQ